MTMKKDHKNWDIRHMTDYDIKMAQRRLVKKYLAEKYRNVGKN